MWPLLLVLLSAVPGSPPRLPSCESSRLEEPVDARLKPVLVALTAAASRNDYFDKDYESAFYGLLGASDAAAKEARVALMAYYVGEHFGEELVCAVQKDGRTVLPLLLRYRQCRPLTSLEPILPRLLAGPVLYDYAAEAIRTGQSCTFEE